jgi:hypothetical protein
MQKADVAVGRTQFIWETKLLDKKAEAIAVAKQRMSW